MQEIIENVFVRRTGLFTEQAFVDKVVNAFLDSEWLNEVVNNAPIGSIQCSYDIGFDGTDYEIEFVSDEICNWLAVTARPVEHTEQGSYAIASIEGGTAIIHDDDWSDLMHAIREESKATFIDMFKQVMASADVKS